MTFVLRPDAPLPEPTPAPGQPAGLGEVFDAGWDTNVLTRDIRNQPQRFRADVMREMRDELGAEEPAPSAEGFADPRDPAFGVSGLVRRDLLRQVEEAARFDPARFGRFPQTEEQLNAEIDRRMQAELAEQQAVLAMGGAGSGITEFAGAMASEFTDPVNLAFGLAGAGRASLARVIMTEGALGGAAELATLPRARAQAERLEIEPPGVLESVALGVAGGAAFGSVAYAGRRGWEYLYGRTQAEVTGAAGLDPYEAQTAIDGVEARLRQDAPLPTTRAPMPGVTPEATAALERLETGLGRRLTVNSAFRDPAHNARVGGASGSQHTHGNAFDVDVSGMSIPERLDLIARAKAAGFSGIGVYDNALHFDVGPARAWGPSFRADSIPDWAREAVGQPAARFGGTTRAGYTAPDEVVTPAGTRIGVAYEIADLDSLIPASGRLQPRDRGRASSAEQVGEIAARLDPARLMPSPEADRGAPIVGPDDVIESGNGRVMAIRAAADQFPDRYAAYVEAIGAEFEIPQGIARPVLVARRTTELDEPGREAFVREANTSAIARMSATEQAGADAAAIDDRVLDLWEPSAPLTGPGNRRFAAAVMGSLPQAERNALFLPDGRLNADGARRMEAALFARAYGDTAMTREMAEAGGGNLRGILAGMAEAAPAWARLRAEIAAGRIAAGLDATDEMMAAVHLIARARTKAAPGQSQRAALDDLLAQGDMVAPVGKLTRRFIDVFYRGPNQRSQADIAAILNAYVDQALRVGSTERRLFAELDELPTPEEILDVIRREAGEATGGDGAGAGLPGRSAAPGRPGPDDRGPGPAGGGGDAGPAARAGGDELALDEAPAGVTAAAPVPDIRAADDGLYAQGAMTPEAIAIDDAALRDIAEAIERDGDFALGTGEGTTLSARALLDDLAEDQELADVIAACTLGGRSDG